MLLAIMDKWNNLPGVVGINTYGKGKKAIMQVAMGKETIFREHPV